MEKGRLAGTLTRHNRPLESYLAGLGFDGATINQVLPWGNQMEASARRFMVGREVFTATPHLTKAEAGAKLRLLLREQVQS